ncbi:MAG: hypothetical protein R3302_07280 [Sulfurimonadaceae bacterium]|nr:hypothetical protein [Sulfurimonadaceae bacterium]
MTYIHAIGIHSTVPDNALPDLKSELKAMSGKVYRRIDHFTQLAIIGAHKAVYDHELSPETAIYMVSGQGNISVFDRVRDQRHIQNQLPRPVDFINLLSNTAGFYVASHLGLEGKNLFLAHHRFPVQMTMLAAQNDVKLGKQHAVLVGGVDEWIEKQELAKKLLGVEESTVLGEGSNWMMIGSDAKNAIGTFDMNPKALKKELLLEYVAALPQDTALAFSTRFSSDDSSELLQANTGCRRYAYESSCGYYETLPLYVLNRFLTEEKGRLVHIDCSDGRYMVMNVDNSGFTPLNVEKER